MINVKKINKHEKRNIICTCTMYMINYEKESLNSDGEQFNQSQQNKRPSLTSNHWPQEKPWDMLMEI